jgi:hypothetical protein
MNDSYRRHRLLGTISRVLMLALALPLTYYAAYFAALEGKVYYSAGVDPVSGVNRYLIEPRFRFGDTGSRGFFRPALWIDSRIRPDYWNTIENKSTGRKWRNP